MPGFGLNGDPTILFLVVDIDGATVDVPAAALDRAEQAGLLPEITPDDEEE